MKKSIIGWLLAFCAVSTIQAQQTELSAFLFPEYKDAVVQYVSGTKSAEKMNYNRVTNKFNFIDKRDGEVKELSDTRTIFMILIGHRNFMPEEEGMTEVFATTPIIYAQYRAKARTKAPEAGYGGTSELTSTKTYVANTGGGSHYFGYDTRMGAASYYNYYWIEKGGKRKMFKDFKGFLKLYPKHKVALQQYIEEKKLDFLEAGDIVNLCMYAEGL